MVSAGGDVTVSALESASITASDASHVVPWTGKGAVIVTNVVLADAQAWLEDSTISGANVTVQAETNATLTATADSKLEAFDESFSFVLAFNTIGWLPSNILFNAVDALLGDPLISTAFNGPDPSAARAWIRDTPVDATGDVSVTASRPRSSRPRSGPRAGRTRSSTAC